MRFHEPNVMLSTDDPGAPAYYVLLTQVFVKNSASFLQAVKEKDETGKEKDRFHQASNTYTLVYEVRMPEGDAFVNIKCMTLSIHSHHVVDEKDFKQMNTSTKFVIKVIDKTNIPNSVNDRKKIVIGEDADSDAGPILPC